MEFYPDADALQQAVLQLFYEKLNKRAQDTFRIKTLSKPRELV